MVIQRATVLNWLLSARVMNSRVYCDRGALDRALACTSHDLPARGRPVTVRNQVLQEMLDQIRAGRVTTAELAKMKQETLAKVYRADRKVCKLARKMALSEAARLAVLK
jgi:hypothetical protein